MPVVPKCMCILGGGRLTDRHNNNFLKRHSFLRIMICVNCQSYKGGGTNRQTQTRSPQLVSTLASIPWEVINFFTQQFQNQRIFCTQNFFFTEIWTQFFFYNNYFGWKNFWSNKFFDQKFFWDQNIYFQPKKIKGSRPLAFVFICPIRCHARIFIQQKELPKSNSFVGLQQNCQGPQFCWSPAELPRSSSSMDTFDIQQKSVHKTAKVRSFVRIYQTL